MMAVRELPVFDPPGLNLSVSGLSIASLLGKEFALGHIVKTRKPGRNAVFGCAEYLFELGAEMGRRSIERD